MIEQPEKAKIIDKKYYRYICENVDKSMKEFPRERESNVFVINKIIEGRPLVFLDWKHQLNRRFYIKEDYTTKQLNEERIIAEKIYDDFRKFIITRLTKDEQDILNTYGVFGDIASFHYNEDGKRESEFTKSLKNNRFILPTRFGDLPVEFAIPEKYGVDDNIIMGYEDEQNLLILFISNEKIIRVEELIQILRRKHRFIHELQHYIDKMLKNWVDEKYDISDYNAYINNPNEVKANIQMIIYTFAHYILKNYKKVTEMYDLQKDRSIWMLFNQFLEDKTYHNVIDEEDLDMINAYISYMNDDNKKLMYKHIYEYIKTDFNPKDKKESIINNTRAYIQKLLRLEESFYEMEI